MDAKNSKCVSKAADARPVKQTMKRSKASHPVPAQEDCKLVKNLLPTQESYLGRSSLPDWRPPRQFKRIRLLMG
jgi:hypothetical protein